MHHALHPVLQPASRFRPTVRSSLWDNFEKLDVVGKGSFGTALLCKRRSDACLIVLKQVDLQRISVSDRKSAVKEAELLSILKHENIVTYYGCHTCDGHLFIEMEYCEMGTLAHFLIRVSRPLAELDALSIFRQIACALSYLDEMNILHRDLKTSNIFLAKHFILKVGDFGIAKISSNEKSATSSLIGTPMNFSPEVCEGKTFSFKSDIWAAGCILYEVICLKQTFEGANLAVLIKNIVTGSYKAIRGPYSRGLKKLVSNLLHKNPDMRPRAYELLEIVDDLLIEKQVNRYQNPWTSYGEPTAFVTNLKVPWNDHKLPARSLLLQLRTNPHIHLERVNVPKGVRLKQVSKSRSHVLLLADDSVYQMSKHSAPTRITSLQGKNVVKAEAGNGFSMFLCDRGLVMSSGDVSKKSAEINDNNPELSGAYEQDPAILDALFSVDVADLSCASDHVVVCCSAGLVYAWGYNSFGCLGLGKEHVGNVVPSPVIVPFPKGTEIEKVFCGEDATMFVDRKKRLWAAGSNEHKKLGLRKLALHSPLLVASVREPVDSVSLSECSTSVQLKNGKTILFGKRSRSLDLKCAKVRRGKILDLGNGIVRSQTTSRFDVALTVENEIYFWGKRLKKRSTRRNSRVSRTLSKTSDSLKDENIAVGETDVPLMEIIHSIGPDNPVILVREPKLIARNMKQLETMDGENELFLHPQLILALYSSQIHLKQCETISFSNLFAFDDDSMYVVVETNIDQCLNTTQTPEHQLVATTSDTDSSEDMTDFENSFEPEPDSEVPGWLRELGHFDGDSVPILQQDFELSLIRSTSTTCQNVSTRTSDPESLRRVSPSRQWKRLCCCLQ